MEGRGGCCIARYATGTYEMSTVDRIMLKYRPIAPKPGTTSDGSSSESTVADVFSRSGGTRRKQAKDNSGNKRCNRVIRRKKTVPLPAMTLPLLPETPDPREPPKEKRRNEPVWVSFEDRGHASPGKVNPAAGLGGSVVVVDSVTDTWLGEGEGEWLGRREEEVKVKLEGDTCPGFISDGYGMVTWTNRAYKEIVGGGGVWLAMKGRVPYPYRWFTCRVKVQYACGKERTVPCDAWRMESGGFAWRLDVIAALTLSLAL